MKTNICKLMLLMGLTLLSSLPAWAIIDKIEAYVGSGAPMKDYERDEPIPIPMLRGRFLRVHGGGTDLVHSITDGVGLDCDISGRKHGIGSYVEMTCLAEPNASTSVRTVTLNYPAGSDTFKIQVKRVGTISKIEYDTSTAAATGGFQNIDVSRGGGGSITGFATPTRLPATNLPQDQEITLVVTGTKLGNVKLFSDSTSGYSGSVVSGATETQCKLKITFTSGGYKNIILRDEDTPDTNATSNNLFNYKGASSPNDFRVQVAANGTGGGTTFAPNSPGLIGGGSTATFVDLAPRANMLNVFRRLSNFTPFAVNGLTFVTVENRWCEGMTGNQSKSITIPNITWGVTNVGTQNINQPFEIVLKSNGTVLATQTVTNLNQGVTRDFTFQRERSQVRVRTRSDRQGCFISPNDTEDFYFEDPQFTVEVDNANAIGEATVRRSNNNRNF